MHFSSHNYSSYLLKNARYSIIDQPSHTHQIPLISPPAIPAELNPYIEPQTAFRMQRLISNYFLSTASLFLEVYDQTNSKTLFID